MAKQTKAKTTETEQVATPAVTPAPVEKKTKTPKAPKTPKVEAAPAVEQPVAQVAEGQSAEETAEAPLAKRSTEFYAKLNQWCAMGASLKAEFKALEKEWARELKTAQKQSSKRKRKSGNRAPSGFTKPSKISDELATFLGKDKGTEMARTDVTREINTYIREHKLQDKKNGRKIIPDAKLAALLKVKKDEEVTYFNLQKYMSPHFPKSEPVAKA